MPNVFDQFDAPAAPNPFDQFDAKPVVKPTNGLRTDLAGNIGGAVLDPLLTLGSGAAASVLGGLAGLATTAVNGPDAGADTVRKVQQALTYQPRTVAGNAVTNTLAIPTQALAGLADTAGGKATDMFGPMAGTAVNTAIQSLPMLLGAAAKVPAARMAANAQAAADAAQASNAVRDAAFAASRAAGYVNSPSAANPTLLNNITEGIAGKIKTQQGLSAKNTATAADATRVELGLPSDASLDSTTYLNYRKQQGQAYADIPQAVPTLQASPNYINAILPDSLDSQFQAARNTFPGQFKNDAIADLSQDLMQSSIPTEAALDQIKKLRSDSNANYAAGRTDPTKAQLAGAQLKAANALEDLIDENLQTNGASPDLMSNYRAARVNIAKSYAAEKATTNGMVDARVYARELAHDRPLSGGMQDAGNAASLSPKAFQSLEQVGSNPAVSPLDIGAAMISGHAYNLPLLGLRPAIRSMILSDWYQNRFLTPSYKPSTLSQLPNAAANAGLSIPFRRPLPDQQD